MPVKVLKFADPTNEWTEIALTDDETPESAGPPMVKRLFTSPDQKVKVYFYKRDQDIGQLRASVVKNDTVKKFDIILAGEVTVTDAAGVEHVAGAGDVLSYLGSDEGRWVANGKVVKIAVSIAD